MESILLFFSTPIKHTSKMLYMGSQLTVNGTFFLERNIIVQSSFSWKKNIEKKIYLEVI